MAKREGRAPRRDARAQRRGGITSVVRKNRAAMLEERARVDEKLGLLSGTQPWRRRWARAVFRLANAPIYVERMARHGFVPFDELLARLG